MRRSTTIFAFVLFVASPDDTAIFRITAPYLRPIISTAVTVPKLCLYGEKLYQYTLVDEYSRWCYREIHAEHNAHASSLFLRNAVKAAPFKIHEVQTDNGHEFTNALLGQKVIELTRFEEALAELKIEYRRIRVGTPKHNGRVERQHGLDMIRFYKRKRQVFVSLEDIRGKLAAYNAWSNSRIKTCLNFRSPIQVIAHA